MTPQEEQDFVRRLYDEIYTSLTSSPDGGQSAFDARTCYFTMCRPGRWIDPKTFANPWGPGNLQGSKKALNEFVNLADMLPACAPLYSPLGHSVADVYGNFIVNAQVVAEAVTSPDQQARLKKADAVLKVTVKDADTGQSRREDSPLYKDYKKNKAAWVAARTAFVGAFVSANKTPEGQETWPMTGPLLQATVDSAYDTWRSGGADQVEDALAVLSTASGNQLNQMFAEAKQLFTESKLTLDDGRIIHRTTAVPGDWCDTDPETDWPSYEFKFSTATANQHSDASSMSAQVGGGGLFWSGSGSVSKSDSHVHLDAAANGFSINYKYTIVYINRPWMNDLLLSSPGWRVQGLNPGEISSGSRTDQDAKKMPLLPVAFLAVKDVEISAQWSASDEDHVKHAMSASASGGFGPFSFGSSYSSSSQDDHQHAEFADGKIKIPGIQVIGFMNLIVPLTPPAIASSAKRVA